MAVDPKTVFVVHGRNNKLRSELSAFLRAIGLSPMEWNQAVAHTGKAAPFVGEVLDAGFSNARAIVVLLTGDDEAKLKSEFLTPRDPDYEKQLTPQPRPNVLFEAGMAFGREPDRTILVEIGELRAFSDISGRHIVRLDDTPEKRNELAQKLVTAGCQVNLAGSDWLKAGSFGV